MSPTRLRPEWVSSTDAQWDLPDAASSTNSTRSYSTPVEHQSTSYLSNPNLRASHSTGSYSTVTSSSTSYVSDQDVGAGQHSISNTSYFPASHRATPYMPLTEQVITQHDHHQTILHSDPQYISNSQSHQANQISTGVDGFNVHLSPNLHAKVVQNQVTMSPMQRFEDPSATPYQQYSAYEPLPNYSYGSAPRYGTPTPYQYSNETPPAQVSPGYSSVRSDDQEPAYSEHYAQPWTDSDGPVERGGLAGVGTQFEYYQTEYKSILSAC